MLAKKRYLFKKVGLYHSRAATALCLSRYLMLAVACKPIAGVPQLYSVRRPNKEGKIHPAILYSGTFYRVLKFLNVGGKSRRFQPWTFGTKTHSNRYIKFLDQGNHYVLLVA